MSHPSSEGRPTGTKLILVTKKNGNQPTGWLFSKSLPRKLFREENKVSKFKRSHVFQSLEK
jgi:hypothetical protein